MAENTPSAIQEALTGIQGTEYVNAALGVSPELRIAKIRRQKRRRSRRAKDKMLASKHHHAQIKVARQRVAPDAGEP